MKSAPYHPASNGLAERAVQIFKQGMKRMKAGSLTDRIARVLFSYRITPQTTTGLSPAELLMGHRLKGLDGTQCVEEGTTEPVAAEDDS